MNKLRAESIPEEVIAGASALVLTSYLVRCKPGEPMPEATMKAIEYAKKVRRAGGSDAGHQIRDCR
jgi:inosine kinase